MCHITLIPVMSSCHHVTKKLEAWHPIWGYLGISNLETRNADLVDQTLLRTLEGVSYFSWGRPSRRTRFMQWVEQESPLWKLEEALEFLINFKGNIDPLRHSGKMLCQHFCFWTDIDTFFNVCDTPRGLVLETHLIGNSLWSKRRILKEKEQETSQFSSI